MCVWGAGRLIIITLLIFKTLPTKADYQRGQEPSTIHDVQGQNQDFCVEG